MGNVATISQHVGDHVRLLHLRILPLDLPELAAVLSRGVPAFHADQGRHLRLAAAWAGVVGDTVGGLATDWLLAKTGNVKFARRAVAIVGMLGCAVFIVPAAMTESAYTAVYCLTAAMFFLECTIGPSWAVPMDIGGEHSGTVSGMMNMAGNYRRRIVAAGVWRPGPVRLLAGAVYCGGESCSFSAPRSGPSGSTPPGQSLSNTNRRPRQSSPHADAFVLRGESLSSSREGLVKLVPVCRAS